MRKKEKRYLRTGGMKNDFFWFQFRFENCINMKEGNFLCNRISLTLHKKLFDLKSN
jgi:hypothetical protein